MNRQPPSVFYWVATTQRTGGGFLADLLRVNDAGNPVEYLNPLVGRKLFDVSDTPDTVLNRYVQYILERNGSGAGVDVGLSGRFIGCKIALSQLEILRLRLKRPHMPHYDVMKLIESKIAERVDLIPGPPPVIYLYRLGVIEQAVSRLRAEITGQWHTYPGESVARGAYADRRDRRINQYMTEYARQHNRWLALLATQRVDFYPVLYEQLLPVTTRADILRAILFYLGHPLGFDDPLAIQIFVHESIRTRQVSAFEQELIDLWYKERMEAEFGL